MPLYHKKGIMISTPENKCIRSVEDKELLVETAINCTPPPAGKPSLLFYFHEKVSQPSTPWTDHSFPFHYLDLREGIFLILVIQLILPGGSRIICMIYVGHLPGSDMYNTDPAQHTITVGWGLGDIYVDRDLFDVWNLQRRKRGAPVSYTHLTLPTTPYV